MSLPAWWGCWRCGGLWRAPTQAEAQTFAQNVVRFDNGGGDQHKHRAPSGQWCQGWPANRPRAIQGEIREAVEAAFLLGGRDAALAVWADQREASEAAIMLGGLDAVTWSGG